MNQYHPKLLKIFTYEQLELLAEHSDCCIDKDDQIYILFSNMDFGYYEIHCDCEAEKLDHANIYVFIDSIDEGKNIKIEEFWELYVQSKPRGCVSICIAH